MARCRDRINLIVFHFTDRKQGSETPSAAKVLSSVGVNTASFPTNASNVELKNIAGGSDLVVE